MRPTRFMLLLLSCTMALGFTRPVKKDNWTSLFNGKDLAGWDTYIGPDLDDKGKPLTGKPLGLNNDPRHVFSIVKDGSENIIRISGENWGAISTKKEYENYHLQLQFKWGTLTWGQKKGQNKDSGLLYHSVGKYGADYGAWMRSQEFQVEESNTGDYWGVAGGMADIPIIKKAETAYVYSPQGILATFSEDSKQGRHCVKAGDAENPSGQWNTLDLYCHGDTSIHVVNGKVMMILYHNRQMDNSRELPLTKGKIQIQSEGAEVFYRQIRVQAIDRLPSDYLK
ncbi:MAG: 3-keto-disaccharide hydrolase [Mucilaginibacter sp.]